MLRGKDAKKGPLDFYQRAVSGELGLETHDPRCRADRRTECLLSARHPEH